jgi:gliding motility-associated-like protein
VNAQICEGQSYLFNGTAYQQTGTYSDTLSTNTCDSIVILQLRVQTLQRTMINAAICEGQIYQFNGNGYQQSGTYTDTLSTAACDSIVTLQLTVTPYPSGGLTADPPTAFRGGTVQLAASAADSYAWTSSGTLSSTVIRNPVATLFNPGWIFVTASNQPGNCSVTDSVYIAVMNDTGPGGPCFGKTYLYLPNAFTPGNGDALNNTFRIYANNIRLEEFRVYNKLGEPVFSTRNIHAEWDGRYRGVISPGNYVYQVIYYECNAAQRKVKSGNVLIIR